MKIAIVTYALNVGGIEAVIMSLARRFLDQGHVVAVFETVAAGRWSQTFRDQGLEVRVVLPKTVESKRTHAKRIAAALRGFDAVILNDARFAQAALGLLDDRVVAIAVLHSTLTSMVRNATTNARNLDFVVAVSPAVAKAAVRFGCDAKRTICVPNGVTVPAEWPKKSNPTCNRGPLRAVFVGAVDHTQKGVLHLPAIMQAARKRGGRVRMDVIGDGPDMLQLRNMLAEDVARGNVTIHGELSNADSRKILGICDVLVMPSYFEGLPIVLLEAMAAGVVPIASRLGECTDFVIKEGYDGFLAPSGDCDEFAHALWRLDAGRGLLRAMSESAWRTALERFDYRKMGDAYLELLTAICARRKGAEAIPRSGTVDATLLGDLPSIPIGLVRPVRKALRALGLFPRPAREPLLVEPE